METVVDSVALPEMVDGISLSVSTDISKLLHPRGQEKIGEKGCQYINESPHGEKERDSNEVSCD